MKVNGVVLDPFDIRGSVYNDRIFFFDLAISLKLISHSVNPQLVHFEKNTLFPPCTAAKLIWPAVSFGQTACP